MTKTLLCLGLALFTGVSMGEAREQRHSGAGSTASRWGHPRDPTNAQYTVQPYTASANLLRWTLNPGYGQTVHGFRWAKASIGFESTFAGNPLKSWNHTRRANIPKPGGENPRINLWLFQGAAPQNGLPVEVVISRFEFLR
jgi:hypothetical protein